MFFTLLLDLSWGFPNKVSVVIDSGAGVEPATVTRTIMGVLSWGELLVASLQQERVPGTVQAEDVLCVCVWGGFCLCDAVW